MKLLLHRFIVLLLLLLQGFTPLVHAHVQADNAGYGVHLHDLSRYTNKAAHVSALELFADSGAVIEMNSAIKANRLIVADVDFAILQCCALFFLQQSFVSKQIVLSPYYQTLKSSIKFSVSAPRAPPR